MRRATTGPNATFTSHSPHCSDQKQEGEKDLEEERRVVSWNVRDTSPPNVSIAHFEGSKHITLMPSLQPCKEY